MWQRVAALRGPFYAVFVCVILPTTVGSQPVTLDDLFGGESLLVGDKLFSDWELVDNPSRTASDPLTTTVEGFLTDAGLVGLRFNGVANDSLVATGNELISFTFRFKVRSLDDLRPIKDVGLELTDFESHDVLDVSEFVFEEGGSPFFDSFAFNVVDFQQTSDESEFSPRETIEVQKTIVLGGRLQVRRGRRSRAGRGREFRRRHQLHHGDAADVLAGPGPRARHAGPARPRSARHAELSLAAWACRRTRTWCGGGAPGRLVLGRASAGSIPLPAADLQAAGLHVRPLPRYGLGSEATP
jgi:hypothetical protein